jgi:hypothetical protein
MSIYGAVLEPETLTYLVCFARRWRFAQQQPKPVHAG